MGVYVKGMNPTWASNQTCITVKLLSSLSTRGFCMCFFLGRGSSTRVWTQGLVHLWVLYHFNHIPGPFCFCYFSGTVSLFCPSRPIPSSFYLYLPHSWDDRQPPPCPAFFVEMGGFANFLPELAWNLSPPDLHLPSRWDYSFVLDIMLRWKLNGKINVKRPTQCLI
jgi:hypothetical protein